MGLRRGLFCLIFTVLDYKLTKRLPRYLTSTEVRGNTRKEEQGDCSVVDIPGKVASVDKLFQKLRTVTVVPGHLRVMLLIDRCSRVDMMSAEWALKTCQCAVCHCDICG